MLAVLSLDENVRNVAVVHQINAFLENVVQRLLVVEIDDSSSRGINH